ncbi:MAG TPA: hypothetical protein VGN54_14660 [Mycobacteriales bacterium]|nr:hypothetical protein [Mycobacteriales bacterium]
MPVSRGRAVWLVCRAQAAALVVLAIVLIVLAAGSRLALSPGFLAADVVGTLLVAALLAYGAGRPRLRTPVLLVQLITLRIAYGLLTSNRPLLAALIGVPALAVVVVLITAVAHGERRGR